MSSLQDRCVLLAPNAFKGSIDAFEFCRIVGNELESNGFSTIRLPMGDGGDGTAEVIASYMQALPVATVTQDALLGRERTASYYRHGDTAIIELASACGIKHLKKEEYDILNTNTAGFGILINHAIEHGVKELILCVGGSASVDGGTGALREMGLKIDSGSERERNYITHIKDIETEYLQHRFKDIHISILCDVINPLCGITGAAAIFGPQKGASPEQVSMLDNRLHHFADLLQTKTGKKVHTLKYGGAAGGITASMHALLGADLLSGSDYCLSISRFREHLSRASLVITGEGKIDTQSLHGKIPGSIATLCTKQNVPIYAVAGLADKQVIPFFDKIFPLTAYARSVHDSISNTPYYLRIIVQEIIDSFYALSYSD